MDHNTTIQNRIKSRAIVGSAAMPGLGQVYNGELLKGACMFFLFLMVSVAGLVISIYLPDRLIIAGILCTLAATLFVWAWSIVDASAIASKAGDGYLMKLYNRWYFYSALWIAGSVFISTGIFKYTNEHVLQFCSIPTGSMEPAVQKGDFVIVDKKAYNRFSPKRNDIVIFVYPDDRSKIYIKRIAGLPGDTMKIESSGVCIVPHGSVYVLGDNRNHAQDSRIFGPVPLADVIGKARQVYLSIGSSGVRWERIGKTL